jgi:hypothetical protein
MNRDWLRWFRKPKHGPRATSATDVFVSDADPSLDNPTSQACTQHQFSSAAYAFWCERIREVPRLHRKQWEFCYILQVLALNDMLKVGRRGVGFGVGLGPLPAVFAAEGCEVLATDLPLVKASEAGWVATNEHASKLSDLNERGICSDQLFRERVRFQTVDMNAIPAEISDFDFTWSACSLEHLGSIKSGLRFIEHSLETLVPGGLAVHTTELNVTSDISTIDNEGTVLFRRRDIQDLARKLVDRGHQINLNFNLGDLPLDKHIDVPPYSTDQHLKLQLGAYATTSYGIVIRKNCQLG